MLRSIFTFILGAFLLTCCGREDAPFQPKGKEGKETPAPQPKPQPTPDEPLRGYEGYMILSDAGLSHIPYNIPEGVIQKPSLRLIDREGKLLNRDIYEELTKEVPELEHCCEQSMTVSKNYLTLMSKYDFSGGGRGTHTSRITLIDRTTFKLVKSVAINLPTKDDSEWVTGSCTTQDGTTYLSTLSKLHHYKWNPQSGQFTSLEGLPKAYLRGAFAYENRAYYVMNEDPHLYLFEDGATKATPIQIAQSGEIRAHGRSSDYQLLSDDSGINYLFSLKENKVVARFKTGNRIDRNAIFEASSGYLYYTTTRGSDAQNRSLFRVKLRLDNLEVQHPKDQLYYRISGRTEADSRQGYFLSIGIDPYKRRVYLSWLDQGRTGPAVENRTKIHALPLLRDEADLPVKSQHLYELHRTYNLQDIYFYERLQ